MALWDARQAAGTVDIFYFLHSIFNYREWHSYELSLGAPLHLTFVRQHKACKVTSTQPLSRKLCGLPSNVIPDSMKTKPEPFWCTEHMAFPIKLLGDFTPEMESVDIAMRCAVSLSNFFGYSANFSPNLEKKKLPNFFKSSYNLLLFFKLNNSLR